MSVPVGYYAIMTPPRRDGAVTVEFTEHPNIVTYGRDWNHAALSAAEALNAALEFECEHDLELPKSHKPKPKRGQRLIYVRIEPEIRMAFVLRAWRRRAKLTQKEMATRLNISFQAYQRMERPGRSNLTVATLQRIAEAMDGELVIELKAPRRTA